jgi:ParB-like chromosome segregation protein Spo0J
MSIQSESSLNREFEMLIDDVIVNAEEQLKLNKLDPRIEKLIELEFDHLKEEIKTHGQLAPIVVNSFNELVSGFKRLLVLKQLGKLTVRAVRQ